MPLINKIMKKLPRKQVLPGGSCGEGYAPGILFDSISKSICLQY